MVLNTVLDTPPTTGSDLTGTAPDHEWTQFEERYCHHHRDCGARQLGDLLGVPASEVIRHMASLGVDVAPVPLLGGVCPSCGGRMPVAGEAAARGICDACNTRLMMELRASWAADRRAYNVSRAVSMGEARHGQGLSEVREGDPGRG